MLQSWELPSTERSPKHLLGHSAASSADLPCCLSPQGPSSSHQHPPGSWHPPSRQGTALKSVTPPQSSSSPALSVSCPTEGALVATGHLHLLPIHVPCLLSWWHCWLKLGHKEESHRSHGWDALRSIPTLHLRSLPTTQPAAEGAESAVLPGE